MVKELIDGGACCLPLHVSRGVRSLRLVPAVVDAIGATEVALLSDVEDELAAMACQLFADLGGVAGDDFGDAMGQEQALVAGCCDLAHSRGNSICAVGSHMACADALVAQAGEVFDDVPDGRADLDYPAGIIAVRKSNVTKTPIYEA
ncbi:MAG: hypothetical protein ACE15C_20860 [Phycisphaerae bacterium]